MGEAGMNVIATNTSPTAMGEVVSARLVAVRAGAPGVNVTVAVDAPMFVGVGE